MHRRVIDDRFELVERLGGGGMGLVWRAWDTALHREVALKEVRPPDPGLDEHDPAAARELRARVLREARALARLNHPHVVTIHHIVDSGEDAYPWLVMELVSGGSLQDRLARGPMTPAETARLGRELLSALNAAHAVGIQHRDVKPANVLLRADGRSVLTDFGIAAVRESTSLTATGSFIGSPEYIAPERINGHEGDPASDLWSLGMLLYVAVEGRHPLRRSTTLATLAAVLNQEVPPPDRAGPLVPVLAALLHRDPAARPDAETLDRLLAQADTAPSAPYLPPSQPGLAPSSTPAGPHPLEGDNHPTPGNAPHTGLGNGSPATSGSGGHPAFGSGGHAVSGGGGHPASGSGGHPPFGSGGHAGAGSGGHAGAGSGGHGPAGGGGYGAMPPGAAAGPGGRQPGHPGQAGYSGYAGYPASPASPGSPGSTGPSGWPGAPGQPGQPGRPGEPYSQPMTNPALRSATTVHGRRRSGRRTGTAVAAATVAVAAVAGVLVWTLVPKLRGGSGGETDLPVIPSAHIGGTPLNTPGKAAEDDPVPVSLLTPAGMRAMLAKLKPVMGGSRITSLTVYPDYASAEAPAKEDEKGYDRFSYRDGKATKEGPGGTIHGPVVDLDKYNWDALPALLRTAEKNLGVRKPTSRYLVINPAFEFGGTHETLFVYVSDAYRSGYLVANVKGKIIRRQPA
uniref:protein kinase domain-containing protein n=1 Tax=Nonomuraea pusilla TaxID=46177 RepID=UPI0006E1C633|nr:protein kinase [Nonomuraea pusilla]